MKPTVILVRHGSTAYNSSAATERIRGWLNIPLDRNGKAEAKKITSDLAKLTIAKVIASPLDRAAYTGKLIAQSAQVPFKTDDRLKPAKLGVLEGRKVKDILPILKRWASSHDWKPSGGETRDTFGKRLIGILEDVFAEAKTNPDQGAIVLVSHTRDLLYTEAWLDHGAKSATDVNEDIIADFKFADATGEGYILTYTNGKWKKKTIT